MLIRASSGSGGGGGSTKTIKYDNYHILNGTQTYTFNDFTKITSFSANWAGVFNSAYGYVDETDTFVSAWYGSNSWKVTDISGNTVTFSGADTNVPVCVSGI